MCDSTIDFSLEKGGGVLPSEHVPTTLLDLRKFSDEKGEGGRSLEPRPLCMRNCNAVALLSYNTLTGRIAPT